MFFPIDDRWFSDKSCQNLINYDSVVNGTCIKMTTMKSRKFSYPNAIYYANGNCVKDSKTRVYPQITTCSFTNNSYSFNDDFYLFDNMATTSTVSVLLDYPVTNNDDDDHGGTAHVVATYVSIAALALIGMSFTVWWFRQYFAEQKRLQGLIVK